MRRKFEYQTSNFIYPNDNNTNFDDACNDLGQEGWEIYQSEKSSFSDWNGAKYYYVLYCKRELIDE